MSEARVFYDKK